MISKNKIVLVLVLTLLVHINHAQDNIVLPRDLQPIVRDNAMRVEEIGDPFFEREGWTRVVEFSHNDAMLFAGYWFSEHILWSLDTLDLAYIPLYIPICNAAFSPDDSLIVISDLDGNIYGYDVSSTKQVFTANSYSTVEVDYTRYFCVMVAFNDSVMAYLDAGIVHLWDYKSRTEPESLDTPGDRLLFSPDGTLLAIALESGDIEIWDVAARERKSTLTGHQSRISSFAFNPNGSQLVSAEEAYIDRMGPLLFLWDVDSGNKLASADKEINEDVILELVFNSDGSMLAFRGSWMISLWNMDNWEPIKAFPDFDNDPTDLAFSIDNSLVVFSTLHGTVKIWDIADDQVYTLRFPQEKPCAGWVNSLDISNDGRLIAAGDECGTVRLFGVSR